MGFVIHNFRTLALFIQPFFGEGIDKDILIKLEADGEIQTNPPSEKRRKGTFGDKVKVTFPLKTD